MTDFILLIPLRFNAGRRHYTHSSNACEISVRAAIVQASYITLSKRVVPVNEFPFISIEPGKPIGKRVHHLPQKSGH